MKRTLLILFGLLLAGFLAFRALFGGQTVSWHQRLTITVETPLGEVSGAAVTAVRKVEWLGPWVLPDAQRVINTIKGEAAVVEVAPGRHLFALLDGESGEGSWLRDAGHWVYAAYGLGQKSDRSYEASMRKLKSQSYNRPVPLPPEGWPLMVTFDDIADPTTVRRVDPDDLAASFGPGVRLKAVTLEVTKAAVTEGRVEGLLGWLGPHPEPALGPATGGTTNIPFFRLVHMGDFIRRHQ
ncbi:MAG: hypothetical protein WBB85_00950 [Albidovulum sp.]|uniref:hypothetical protein n=1 Tax=Albidovulum sp. TaxID=1872424 RepID=UPI003CAD57A1